MQGIDINKSGSFMQRIVYLFAAAALAVPLYAQQAPQAGPATLRVGAAKIDITPPPTAWKNIDPFNTHTYEALHDPIYARVMIIDAGSGPVAMVALDLVEVLDMMPLRQRIQREIDIAPDHIIITASHDHSGPHLRGGPSVDAPQFPAPPEEEAYATVTHQKILDALKTAKAAMQPARMGFGTGVAEVNVNRDQYSATRGWIPGNNPGAPSDKTVWVVKFETLTGDPIAIWFNYAVHSIVTFNLGVISGDLAGAAERTIEEHYNGNMVAMFTMGDAGNQHPRYVGAGTMIGDPDRVPGDKRDIPELRRQSYPAMEAQGWMLGSEVLHVAKLIEARTTAPRIVAAETMFSCPAKPDKQNSPKDSQDYSKGDPIRIGVVRIDQLALAWISAEVVYNINAHLKSASPLSNTVMVTEANGRSGYLPDDASYDTPNFETKASTVARGCAENGVVSGFIDLIQKTSSTDSHGTRLLVDK
jgi:neutral ceramidase